MAQGIVKPVGGVMLDKGNPLSRGMVSAYLFNEGTTNEGGPYIVHDSVGRYPLAKSGSAADWRLGRFGRGIYFQGNTGANYCVGDSPDIKYNGSVAYWFKPTALGNDTREHFSYFDNTASKFGPLVTETTDNSINFIVRTTSNVLYISISAPTNSMVLNKWCQVVATWETGVYGGLYINGKLVGEDTDCDPGVGTPSSTDSLYLGCLRATWGRAADGVFDHFLVWDRPLKPSEVKALYTNPFQMFKQASIAMPYVVTDGGGTTEAVSGSISAQSAISGKLKQTVKLKGSISANSSASGSLKSTSKLRTSISGQSAIGGRLKATSKLRGGIRGQSAIGGKIGTGQNLKGAIAGQSAISGKLKATVKISSGATGRSGIGGRLKAICKVKGSISGQSAVNASVSATIKVRGGITGTSSIKGTIHSEQAGISNVAGSITGVSNVSGKLTSMQRSAFVQNARTDMTQILSDLGTTHTIKRRSKSWQHGIASTTWTTVQTCSAVFQPVDGKTIREEQGLESKSDAVIQVAWTVDIKADDRVYNSDGRYWYVNYVKRYEDHLSVYLTIAEPVA